MIIFLDILKTDLVRHAGEVLKTMRIHKMPKVDDWVYLKHSSNQGQYLKSREISKEAFYVLEELNWSIRVNGMNSRLSWIYLFQNISRMPDHCHKTQRTSLSFRISRIYLVWLRPLFQGSLSPSHILSSCNACCLPYPDKNTRKTPCFDSTLGKRAYKAFEWEAKFVWVMRGVLSEETIFRICTQRYFTKLHLTHEIFRILPV